MNPFRALETWIANLVEGAFGRVFRSEVRPIELAHKLAREMDMHRTASVSRTYAPNEYLVWLSPEDRARYEGVEQEVIEELCAYLLEHARREDLILASQPLISFHTDQDLSLGEFGIQARLVRANGQSDMPSPAAQEAAVQPGAARAAPRPAAPSAPSASPGPPAPSAPLGPPVPPGPPAPPAPPGPPAPAARPEPAEEHGQTMIYSTSARVRRPVEEARARRPPRALLAVEGKRMPLPPQGGVVGRSRDCDVVLGDTGVSRRHAELRPSGAGWTVVDLSSTNGVRVNGRQIRGVHPLSPGDRLQLGSTEIVFEVS